jgi:hypothetical protein
MWQVIHNLAICLCQKRRAPQEVPEAQGENHGNHDGYEFEKAHWVAGLAGLEATVSGLSVPAISLEHKARVPEYAEYAEWNR